ncbi:MAG: hypothetical protein AB8B64_14005 [Granulosicoccus sp.]
MKILVAGNSHIGALMKARAESPDDNIQFLTYNGNTLLQNLQVNERCELSSTRQHITDAIVDQGLKQVSLNSFDYIFIYGCQLRAAGNGENWLNVVISTGQGFSEQAHSVALRDYVRNTAHYRFLEEIHNWPFESHVKIVSMPSPVPNELAAFSDKQSLMTTENADKVKRFMENEIKSVGFDYLETPESLWNEEGFMTSSRFKADRGPDMAHLNTAGGHEVLKSIVAYTDTKSANVAA